jgi:hypothetical protein
MSFEVRQCYALTLLYTFRRRNLTMPSGIQEVLLIPCVGRVADFVGPYAG